MEDNWVIPREKYKLAIEVAMSGDVVRAEGLLRDLAAVTNEPMMQGWIDNDLGVLCAVGGNAVKSEFHFTRALDQCPISRRNLTVLNNASREFGGSLNSRRRRIAIVSTLFNWPSTGGGVVHTGELAYFLTRSGYEVRHLSVHFEPWGIGRVHQPVDWDLRSLPFEASDWNRESIESRIRGAVDEFQPDAVIVTDSWSMKSRIALALSGYRVFLRLAAQECLCPLNNVRLLSIRPPMSCPRHQLANPSTCRDCVVSREHLSGSLHQSERHLAGFYDSDYSNSVREAFASAAGVLVVNPLIAETVKPFAQAVHVIPSGFDQSRFPWIAYQDGRLVHRPTRLLFAGLIDEPMKGYEVLHAACQILHEQRKPFRLCVTSDPTPHAADWIDFIGWQSQADLPQRMRDADIVVCPTIAEEALGRTAVEAMGAWRPVVASRIGGLPFTVLEHYTGLLAEPGDPEDLARQLACLIEDSDLRERLGTQGRQRFAFHYEWKEVINRHYIPLLGPPAVAGGSNQTSKVNLEASMGIRLSSAVG